MTEIKIDSITVDDESLKVTQSKLVDPERLARYVATFPDGGLEGKVVQCTVEQDGEQIDHIVKVDGDNTEVFLTECKISYEDVSPTQLIEYQFSSDGDWFLAHVALPSLEYYRQSKYDIWKNMLIKPNCEAALKRMLNTGIISELFDDQIFITPAKDVHNYEVEDENGKTVRVPHPVHALRVWDSSSQGFKAVSAHLEGAPEKDEEEKEWTKLLGVLNTEHGEEYIQSLLD